MQQTAVMSKVFGKSHIDVNFVGGEAYEAQVREHRILVDQPHADGGADQAPTPTELFVASLASCVAFYAGRYLDRHGYDRDGLGVGVDWWMATDRPARIGEIRLAVRVGAQLPEDQRRALLAVASHCTVHNTITGAPTVTVALA